MSIFLIFLAKPKIFRYHISLWNFENLSFVQTVVGVEIGCNFSHKNFFIYYTIFPEFIRKSSNHFNSNNLFA
jgi:hypothetical protein